MPKYISKINIHTHIFSLYIKIANYIILLNKTIQLKSTNILKVKFLLQLI